ncbi:Beta-1 like protein [Verticillium longisporum]|uniref:Glycosyl transferase CAP10 domain-containing protein n=3 Tax=Verticillium TaxID=1036719 RepID=G2XJ92_VERDV|nr:uncharacterized protein VDAG_10224 [Verticillium dahliae VdLs.17]KAF3351462.1 Autophagy protein 16 [Verticillium dahliae VDG2]KAF3355026.1 hypothetical protein VdG1_04451 [Verticillium dahliae VDG1]KAG7130619.1 Beta-1 like protein [Verticillium longisporum]KAH6694412.1 hypothetical protein EV126DRAFT_427737 [Verticillium dahliae]EGY20595.1 hypothetical protein VDAG_10224 [Verticillium dahliae VdLs.17]
MRRRRQLTVLGLIVFLTLCAWSLIRIPAKRAAAEEARARKARDRATFPSEDGPRRYRRTPPEMRPKALPDKAVHPVLQLISEAEREMEKLKARQSKTLQQAVEEYKRRNNLPPPPHFDKWFEFAKANGVQLVDEFDMINEMITPFWGLKPKTIRSRAKEALGHDNQLVMMLIRDHQVTHVQGAHTWQREATAGMVSKFIQYLPSMDLAFNIHDEPRVVLPHEDLARLINIAKNVNMPKANAAKWLKNKFSPKPREVGRGDGINEVKTTRFNVYAHQPVWTTSRMSCPADSPARSLEDEGNHDDASKFGVTELGFVYNITALSDICLSPSLATTYGFFDAPNAYNIAHDLFPIFSQSKISSYQDILYPSPWYWYEKVEYDDKVDAPWAKKKDQLYWRGSTTGGYSREGGWRRQHRQRFVQRINSKARAQILVDVANEPAPGADPKTPPTTPNTPQWEVRQVARGDYQDVVDVAFSYVGQCDPGDCDAQHEFFKVQEHAEQTDAWAYKYLLDIDGNAFSGRFYAFLRSKSLTFKYAIFREWHFEWIKPWAHYIPLSLQGDEWLESIRFFREEEAGIKEAERLAKASTEWAGKVLRKEDMEVWFFRMLLEYARVIDDNREAIGFDMDAVSN